MRIGRASADRSLFSAMQHRGWPADAGECRFAGIMRFVRYQTLVNLKQPKVSFPTMERRTPAVPARR
jgi:hypothetical protein